MVQELVHCRVHLWLRNCSVGSIPSSSSCPQLSHHNVYMVSSTRVVLAANCRPQTHTWGVCSPIALIPPALRARWLHHTRVAPGRQWRESACMSLLARPIAKGNLVAKSALLYAVCCMLKGYFSKVDNSSTAPNKARQDLATAAPIAITDGLCSHQGDTVNLRSLTDGGDPWILLRVSSLCRTNASGRILDNTVDNTVLMNNVNRTHAQT